MISSKNLGDYTQRPDDANLTAACAANSHLNFTPYTIKKRRP